MLNKPVDVRHWYRSASQPGAPREDGFCINPESNMFVVCDGVSGPYSPSNPKIMYGSLTGGQMVGATIRHIFEGASANQLIEDVLCLANDATHGRHLWAGKFPGKEAVAGACVSACQIKENSARLVLAGDCFAIWRNAKGVHSLTNFDQAAYDFEKKGDEAFRKCLDAVDAEFPVTKGKNIGKAWDEYFPYFSDKQLYRANRNTGRGGHAMLNGDPHFAECWTNHTITLQGLEYLLLLTDGLLPPHLTCPTQHATLAKGIAHAYETGGPHAIGNWRDGAVAQHESETKGSDMPHIEGYPEGSVIAIKFSE